VKEPLADAESGFTEFGDISKKITERLQMGNNLLQL